ncbi:MAG: PIN domain-containing protein [Burkholderiales bacterium]
MIWLLDTNTLGYLVNRSPGAERIKRRLSGRSPGELRLSAITLSEIHYGLARGDVSLERREAFSELLELFEVEAYPAAAARDFGEIRAALERAGKGIGPYDLLIAAHARHIRAVLVTNNEREFRRVPGLAVQNWLKP